ncbi:hypothetical protein ABB37_03645 [Leptomonas pyrrhocoris]|uniref:Uncharacterized protein n=1 Tax=Leptomonas pyrrhocoris TaxID=157538 RepID=A0A0M9G2U5_LEPPY|nr:hypothetical protein ABB37_03645 [Leptomonas pyrrhocoris]KPA81225.1 hypothetical protein ABB37_03645 [Leptomonas pyrrhocoris]|eukprot:XP_015659664.1 hypothetical protein ABB37_03645 [Leptomonas pyrrhocoris]
MSLSEAVGLLRQVYTCPRNEDRRGATLHLLRWEKTLSAADAVQIGLGLLKSANEGLAVQAYGAVLLRHGLHARLIRPTELPFMDLLAWYCNEPTLAPLLRSDLVELIIECVIYSEHDVVDRVLTMLCSESDTQPRRMLLLSDLTVALIDPDFDRVPRQSIGTLKRSVTKRGGDLLHAATMALYAYYMAAGGEHSTALAPNTESSVEAAFLLVATLAPQLPFPIWQEHNLAATLEVLLRWVPAQRQAITCATGLLRSYSVTEAKKAAMLQVLLRIVLGKIPTLVADHDIAALDDVLDLLLDLPREFTQLEGVLMVQNIMTAFNLPSIQFAQQVVQLMERLDENTYLQVDPVSIYSGLRLLLPKNLCHPTHGSNQEGKELSQEQFGFDRLFEDVFADFRRSASKVLTLLARLYPERTNQFLLNLLSELPDSRGTPEDPRTLNGFVQQSSLTFVYWEATQFMMECLSMAFEYSSIGVNACVSTLLTREPSDAVLLPLFLNMISYFWKARDDQELNVWEGTITILFNCINDEATRRMDDLDVLAARRRAHTLLVQLCVEHSRRFLPLVHPIMKRMEPMLVHSHGMERSLLYEALIALTAILSPHESDAYLQTIINPLVDMLSASPALAEQNAFNRTICAATPDDKDNRGVIQGCLNTLAAVFRRCQMTPYVVEKATQLFPVVGRLLVCVHSIEPSALPPEFRGIVEQERGEKDLYLPGNQRKSEAHLTGPVRSARGVLMNLRIAVYQVFGCLSPILPAEQFAGIINALMTTSALPTHVERSLSEKCLLPIGKEHPALLIYVLQLLHRFFVQRTEQLRQQQATSSNQRNARDEVAESKQWLYFAKDILTFLRNNVLDSKVWQRDKNLLMAAADLAVSVFESGSDTRTAERFLISLVNLNADTSTAPDVQATLSEVRVMVYARLVSYVTQAPAGELPPGARDQMAYGISEPYMKLFPNLAPSLTLAGISQEQQETLNAHLLIVSNFSAQRRKVKDFLLGIAAANLTPQERS